MLQCAVRRARIRGREGMGIGRISIWASKIYGIARLSAARLPSLGPPAARIRVSDPRTSNSLCSRGLLRPCPRRESRRAPRPRRACDAWRRLAHELDCTVYAYDASTSALIASERKSTRSARVCFASIAERRHS